MARQPFFGWLLLLPFVVFIANAKAAIQFEIPQISLVVSGSQAATGYLDLKVHVESADLPKSVSSLNVDVVSTSASLSFGPAEAASRPLLAGDVLNFSNDAQIVRAGIDVFPASDSLFDGAGLVRVPFQVPSGVSGVFPVEFGQFNELTDTNAMPLAIQTADVGSISVTIATAGDYNHNGVVDAADFIIWRNSLGSSSMLAADGDLNGTVGLGDFEVWRSNYGDVSGSLGGASILPEPRSLMLLAAMVFVGSLMSRLRING